MAKKVAEAINVPLIVWGTSNDEKNTEVLKAVAEACTGLNVVIGPVTEGNYKQVGAAAIAYKHVVAANSPIDINLAKQLNILLENLGVPNDKILSTRPPAPSATAWNTATRSWREYVRRL